MKNKLKKLIFGRSVIKIVVRVIVVLYVLLLFATYFFGDRIIFPGRNSYQDDAKITKVKTKDGLEISLRYLSYPQAEYTILFSHGNAEDLGDVGCILEILRNQGYSVAGFDYRGYGTSQGKVTEKNAYQDIETVYDYLVNEKGVAGDKIILHGRSIGGPVAADLAVKRKVAGLILESSPVAAFQAVTWVPILPFDKLKTLTKLEKVDCPVMVIHGTSDRIVPIWNGRKLLKNVKGAKSHLWVEGAGHNDLLSVAKMKYFEAINEFVQTLDAK